LVRYSTYLGSLISALGKPGSDAGLFCWDTSKLSSLGFPPFLQPPLFSRRHQRSEMK
jgi:hypothetical protein